MAFALKIRVAPMKHYVTAKIQQDFVDAVEQAYRTNAMLYGRTQASRSVCRGRGRCCSGILEDLFALLIHDYVIKDPVRWVVLVDCPVKLVPDDEKRNRYPDFAIYKRLSDDLLELVYMADLKTNTGYFRGKALEVLEKKRDEVEAFLSAREASVSIKGKRFSVQFAAALKSDLIIYSNANANAVELEEQQRSAVRAQDQTSLMYILGDWAEGDRQIPRHEDFNALEERIVLQLKGKGWEK